jgi:hypothetical protein
MTLAPIRGAPPGAPNPDFPVENPRTRPAQPIAAQTSDNKPPLPPVRQRHTPIQIDGGGATFTFKVIPEQAAIARASLTVHVTAGPHALGFLRMSASNARRFLIDLGNCRSPIVATGDEDGDVQIEYESTAAGPVLMVRKPGEQDASHRWIIDTGFDLQPVAKELLADRGA